MPSRRSHCLDTSLKALTLVLSPPLNLTQPIRRFDTSPAIVVQGLYWCDSFSFLFFFFFLSFFPLLSHVLCLSASSREENESTLIPPQPNVVGFRSNDTPKQCNYAHRSPCNNHFVLPCRIPFKLAGRNEPTAD